MTELPSVVMSVFRESWPANTAITHDQGCTALCLQSGELSHNGQTLHAKSGIYMAAGDQITARQPVQLIRFTVTPFDSRHNTPTDLSQIRKTPILSNHIHTTLTSAILRLDQVDFPPKAIAYRHTHPGAGIRYLVHGSLHIQSDHAEQQMEQGQAWFEDADSPVKATAGSNSAACFIRLMLLPMKFEGQPTLNTLDPVDAAQPRLQTNTRYFDQRVELDHLM